MEIANTSGAVWLLMLDISERPSEEGDNRQDLSLLCLGDALRVSLSCNLHDGSLVCIYIYICIPA